MKLFRNFSGLGLGLILAISVAYPDINPVKAPTNGPDLLPTQIVNTGVNTSQKGLLGAKDGPKVGINEAYYWEIMHFSQTICVADSFSSTGYSMQYEEWDEWWKIRSSDNKVVQKIIGPKLQVLIGICNSSKG